MRSRAISMHLRSGRARFHQAGALLALSLLFHQSQDGVSAARELLPKGPGLRPGVEPNNRPLIGIVSQAYASNSSYIAASYVKFVEMAGGRAVPFFHDMTNEQIESRFKQVNGILLPGGGATLEPGCGYYDVSKKLIDLVIEANDKGETVPMQATCLGFEALVIAISGNTSILEGFDAYNLPSPLVFTEAAHKSRFFGSFPPSIANLIRSEALTMENHESGISPGLFMATPALRDTFEVLTLSADHQGTEYVSTIEAREYPIFATQWHPEKNAFEWLPYQGQPHSRAAVEVTFAVAKNLVDLARMNTRRPVDYASEIEMQIYNYPVQFTAKDPELMLLQSAGGEASFYQVYVFPDGSSSPPLTKRLIQQQ